MKYAMIYYLTFNCGWDTIFTRCKESIYIIHIIYYFYMKCVGKDVIQLEEDVGIIVEDKDLEIWEKRVDTLTPTTINKYTTETTPFSTLRNQFNTELSAEKNVPSKVKHMYNALINATGEEELITVFESFLPESFNEEDVSEIIDMIEKKQSRNEIYTKLQSILV